MPHRDASHPVICMAAIRTSDGAIHMLPKPARHNEIERKLMATRMDLIGAVKGFLTSDGGFVDRQRAAIIALSAGQIERTEINWKTGLFSDDLW